MKLAIFVAIVAAVCLTAQASVAKVPSKETRITCDLFGPVLGPIMCGIHCAGHGLGVGTCTENNYCSCKGGSFPTCNAPAPDPNTRFTCNAIGGIFGNAACSLHCILHGCDLGMCSDKNECNCRNYPSA